MDLWQYERQARDEGWTAICGCDEAGAGPLAGPVYAAAVILPLGHGDPGLNDSKKLSEKKREELFPASPDPGAGLVGGQCRPGGDRCHGHPQCPDEGYAAGH